MTLIRVARDMSAKHVGLSSNLNSVFSHTAHWSSLEWTPPCHGGATNEYVGARGSNPVWVAKKFELRSEKFEISHFELPASNFIWCGTPTAERLVLGTSD